MNFFSGAASPSSGSSGIGISHLPNQKHRIVSRQGANFTMMVVGSSGLGKTTYINTLFATLLKEYRNVARAGKEIERTVSIDVVRADIDEKGFKVRLTIVDTPGFGDYMNNQDCWVPIIEFLDEQHALAMKSETGANRYKDDDLRVHACLYFIHPTGHTLSGLDIKVMKLLGRRVNLIPIIAKGDTLSKSDLKAFKRNIMECIHAHEINIFRPPTDDHPEYNSQALIDAMPYSIIGSEKEVRGVRGREYLWGIAEVENEDHCDFVKLRDLLIRCHMYDLIKSTEENHFEEYRIKKLTASGFVDDDPAAYAKKNLMMKMKQDEEALVKKFTEQARLEEARFRKWGQNLIAERDRLHKDLDEHLKAVEELQNEIDALSQ